MSAESALTVTVTRKDCVAEGVVLLHLAAKDGSPLPDWSPGAHVDLILGDGLVRQYSLSGDPADQSHWRLGILREPESCGGSAFICEQLKLGDELEARGPWNNFPLEPAQRYLFIAGGIEITPIVPMVAEATRNSADWKLVYGGRRRDSMAFLDELGAYGERMTVVPQDQAGLLDLDTILRDEDDRTLVYCCGPEGLLQAVEDRTRHLPRGTLHIERFHGLPLEEATWDGPFEVVFEQSGVTATVEPGQTIIEVAEDMGVPVMYSYSEGTCGTCETRVLQGTVRHRDAYLDEGQRAAGDRMMICVSRSAGPQLVLDL